MFCRPLSLCLFLFFELLNGLSSELRFLITTLDCLPYEQRLIFSTKFSFFVIGITASDYQFGIFKLYYASLCTEFHVVISVSQEKMFGSSLHPVVCKKTRVIFLLFVFACA